MTRRRYSKTEKARVVADALNSSTEAASERAGIPRSTVRYWLDQPEFASLRHETREAVAEQFWAAIQVGLKEVANGLRDPDTALRDKSVALGILYDKHALLTGGATNRSESRDITGSISDADLVAAVREAERLTGEGRTAPETAGEAAG
jgi:transposase-like protein